MKLKPLASAYSQIERAETHIHDLNQRIESFFEGNPYKISSHVDPKRDEEIWQIQVNQPIPSEIYSIIEDAVHNIRTPLDKMLSAYISQGGRSPKGVWFPVADTLRALKEPKGHPQRGIKKLSVDMRRFLMATKPYKRGNPLLWAIHEIDIGHKHWDRLVDVRPHPKFKVKRIEILYGFGLVLGSVKGQHLLQPRRPTALQLLRQAGQPMGLYEMPGNEVIEFSIAPKFTKEGYEFLTTTPGAKPKVRFYPSFDITFGQVPGFESEPVVSTLYQMRDLVKGILLAFEERFFS
ncbi:hypothetical protein [Mesorhizobium sp. LNJC403B00]|uniref:hypothetical protein n=1 Tax=Mesorhizobium sp. LNJC403B00 TaxID=1287280 RepID=UPI0003CF31BB|nr:hypothetical protein [Mesorhizobium sp. LNJC403B00]ESX87056.1 hypothetical protein X754_28655 [Mesorhizobium sp. LNJC403B00]